MGVSGGPDMIQNGLILAVNAADRNSYVSGSTTWRDLSSSNSNGTIFNSPVYSSANSGILIFDGVDDYVDLSSTISSSEWSLCCFLDLSTFQKIRNTQTSTITSNTAGSRNGRVSFEFTYSTTIPTIVVDNSGSVFIGGRITEYNGISRALVVKLDSSGSLDSTFDTGLTVTQTQSTTGLALDSSQNLYYVGYNQGNLIKVSGSTGRQMQAVSTVNASITQANVVLDEPNNKVYIGGWFSSIQSVAAQRLARLNLSTMTIDTTFDTTTGFVNLEDVQMMILQPDGKLLVGGQFTSYKSSTYNRIIRLNSNASIDTTFNPGVGFNDRIVRSAMALQTDGKILVGGVFTTYSGSTTNRIVRLNPSGTIDTTFNAGTGFGSTVNTIALQSDGKVLVGGGFTTYSGSTSNYIIRLNDSGSIDTTFKIGTGFNNSVEYIYVQQDQKILVGGVFTTYSGSSCNNIVRLNSDGTVDTSFNVGTGILGAYRLNCQTVYTNASNAITSLFEYRITSPTDYDWRNYETAISPLSGSFSYFVITKDSASLYSQYWNTALKNTESLPTALNTGINVNRLGTIYGKVASIYIYNRALSQQEIIQNYTVLKSRFNL